MWEDVETRCWKRLGAGEWGSYVYQDFREMVSVSLFPISNYQLPKISNPLANKFIQAG